MKSFGFRLRSPVHDFARRCGWRIVPHSSDEYLLYPDGGTSGDTGGRIVNVVYRCSSPYVMLAAYYPVEFEAKSLRTGLAAGLLQRPLLFSSWRMIVVRRTHVRFYLYAMLLVDGMTIDHFVKVCGELTGEVDRLDLALCAANYA